MHCYDIKNPQEIEAPPPFKKSTNFLKLVFVFDVINDAIGIVPRTFCFAHTRLTIFPVTL